MNMKMKMKTNFNEKINLDKTDLRARPLSPFFILVHKVYIDTQRDQLPNDNTIDIGRFALVPYRQLVSIIFLIFVQTSNVMGEFGL